MTDTSALFLTASSQKLTDSVKTLGRCLDRITDEQVWSRGGEYENAVGNLVLHLCGNIRQWIIHGVGGHADVRVRDAEFSADSGYTRAELLALFSSTIDEAIPVINSVSDSRLLETMHAQQRTKTVLEAIYMVVGHVEMHMGQIIFMTKQLAGTDLDFTIPRPR